MIIDSHNHVWPDALAKRALSGNIPDMTLCGDGTVGGLAIAQRHAGVDRSVCLAIANSPERVEAANRFVGGLDRTKFIPFGTIHPRLKPEENLASLRRHKMLGVKLHPVFQDYRLDDPGLWDTLDALAGEFPVIMHVGAGGSSDGSNCTPRMARAIIDRFPDLLVIACHFGGYHKLDEAEEHMVGANCYLDTAWPPSLDEAPTAKVRDIILRHGCERVVFASDWPTASPTAEIESIHKLKLADDETRAVLGANMETILAKAAKK